MSRNHLFAAASIALVAFGVAPSIAQEASSGPACGTGEQITVNLLAPVPPSSLDANYDTIIDFLQITRNMYDGLFRLDDAMQVQPWLATEYSQPDNRTYSIKLREDVVFHDGSRFTADDVVSTFSRIATDDELKSKQRSYVANVESVTKVSDYEVEFTLKEPDASFLRVLANIIFITPKSAIEQAGNVEFGQNPVGSGPFKFERWNQGDSVVLTANCDYWSAKPIPSRVEFRFISEPATQISSLQSGEIDIATHLAPDLASALDGNSEVWVQSTSGNLSVWLSMNTLEGPFSDQRVRQALNYAVDRDAIAKELYGGYATPLGQPYTPGIFGYSESVTPYAYDPEMAKSLLAEAGYDDSNKLTIELINYRPEWNPVWQSVASYFGDVGVAVTTKFDPNYFADVWLAKKLGTNQVGFASNANVLMDADFALGLTLDGKRRGLYFNTPDTDAAIAEARGLADIQQRQAVYDRLNANLKELAPLVFLFSTNEIYGTSRRITWTPRLDGAIYLAGITKTP